MTDVGPFDAVSQEDYRRYGKRAFGEYPGQRQDNPLWIAAVKCGWGGYGIAKHFGDETRRSRAQSPTWCFRRLGRTCTFVDDFLDGTSHIWIAGDHEHSYDPHFCTYNDVVVTKLDGSVEIYGYPNDHFPPTDFHSATLVQPYRRDVLDSDRIIIIGRLGYPEDRILGTTPIFELDLYSKHIRELTVRGEEPGWIFEHEALWLSHLDSIAVWGGRIIDLDGETKPNQQAWLFNLNTQLWSRTTHLLMPGSEDR